MTAFATLTAGENALSLAMANELVLAYSERRQALGQSSVSNLAAGTIANDKTTWLAMQVWMEANCTSFVDSSTGSVQLNPGGTDFLYFTLATWRAAAGLNASGFRRSTDGTTMAYGNITAGDVWGKWTFEDLQKGFAALKWTERSITKSIFHHWLGGESGATWTDAITETENDWHDDGTYTVTSSPGSVPICWSTGFNGDSFVASIERRATILYCEGLPALSRTPVLYAYGRAPSDEPPDYYYTFDGNAQLSETFDAVDTQAPSSGTSISSSFFNSSSIPDWVSEPPKDYAVYFRGYASYSAFLLKWNFTNA